MLLTPFDIAAFCYAQGELGWGGRIERPRKRWLAGHRYTRMPTP